MGIKINIFSRQSTPRPRRSNAAKSSTGPTKVAGRSSILNIDSRRKLTLGVFAAAAVVLVLILILLFRNWLTIGFPSAVEQPEWNGEDELTVALLGLDDGQQGLYFVDSIQIAYFKPNQKQVRILSVDPQLSVNLPQLQDIGRNATGTYHYSQIINYYIAKLKLAAERDGRSLTDQELLTNASREFIFHLESELGVHIDRYFSLQESKFNRVLSPFGYSYLDVTETVPQEDQPGKGSEEPLKLPALNKGQQWLNLEAQYRYASYLSSDPEARLEHQAQLLKSYLSSTSHPNRTLGFVGLVLDPKLLSGLDGNFTKSEIWKLFLLLRGVPEFNISTQITSKKLMYFKEGHKFLDRKLVDKSLQDLYKNQNVLFEQARVDVINGSQRGGLAAKVKRLLTNYSFTVVRTDNSSDVFTHNTLYVTYPSNYPNTISQLKRFYPDLQIRLQEYPGRPTGDMVLVVI